jgi:hypothetical protein
MLQAALKSAEGAPDWLRDLAGLSYKQILELPEFSGADRSNRTLPTVQETTLQPDYIAFLKEQVRLEPRGPEWGAVLRRRLVALVPFVGRRILSASFHQDNRSASVDIDSETGELLHLEVD